MVDRCDLSGALYFLTDGHEYLYWKQKHIHTLTFTESIVHIILSILKWWNDDKNIYKNYLN